MKIKYPFREGESYFTIEDGDIVESVWDSISEELHRSDKQYFTSLEEAKLSPLATKSIHLL